jgi:hypothetical protein
MGINFVRVGIILALVGACPAWAGIIFESSTMGPAPAYSGATLNTSVFLGARFQVTSPVQVTAIGGHLWEDSGTFFGAIVSLTGSTALPTGSPFDGTVLASTTFVGSNPSSDYRTPLSVALGTGWYGLVFGAGQLGSVSGAGAMPMNNTDLVGSSYFFWNGSSWNTTTSQGLRFVVEGPSDVPEPSTFVLLGTSVLGLALLRRRR